MSYVKTKGGIFIARITDNQNINIVGKNIKKLRVQKKLSQKQLSEKLETLAVYICRGSISRIEENKRTVTDIELKGFADVFRISINELFDSN